MHETTNDSPAPLRLLAIGAITGLLVAGYGLLQRTPENAGLPADAVARVNDAIIHEDRYRRAIDGFTAAYGSRPSADDRARILMQLVEEELLVQRGIELGMPASEATVRVVIVQSLIASVTAQADAADPDEAELQAFLDANAERYTFASALSVDAWIADDEYQAQDFVARLRRGDDVGSIADVRPVPGLPSGPLPLERLRMFVGPAIAAATVDMPIGENAVFVRQGRWYVVRVNARDESVVADLEGVRSQVLIDYRRDLADARLRDYLDDLIQQADVTIAVSPATGP